MKICKKCNILKSFLDFYKDNSSKDKFSYYCKECMIEKSKIWRKENKEIHRKYSLKYQKENRVQTNIKNKNWRKKFPEKNLAKCRERQMRKMRRMPKWLNKEQRKNILEFYKQARKLTLETGIKYEVDHIIPLKAIDKKTKKYIASGLHVPWNLQVITAEENGRKGNKI